MDWKQKLQSARIFGQQSKEVVEKIAQEKLREHWPRIQQLFEEKVGPAALAAAKNDEMIRPLFERVYWRLPRPVRMVVKEETFVRFCMKNKDRLVPSRDRK
ncbi:MAG: hypothetical protein IH856_13945 [Deltaproteobacteria bacterium]|nr:hypothetical protein [Deltaproteobacteria bacterium]MCZ6451281.1 hypothetical protein [Deltaproteobacteria bacterium]MCZ6549187.1 hypothetical protein [Deltaproteobacteria bacterium]MCZ6561645.1 hypothetical protein [Deltaproteobacteria bacterium]MCZ6621351.1 hypothetical protein [Deltaproteobacteria bacterium]